MNIDLPPLESLHLNEKKHGETIYTLAPRVEFKPTIVKVDDKKYVVYWTHHGDGIKLEMNKLTDPLLLVLLFACLWGLVFWVWLMIKLWRWISG